MTEPWQKAAEQIRAIARTGLHYSENNFDLDRYRKLLEIADHLAAAYSAADAQHISQLFALERGYVTPKVDMRAGIIEQDKILLVREVCDGRWSLPGGFADIGDAPATAIEREVLEEAGFEVRAEKLVALFDRDHPRHGHDPFEFHTYKVFFLCSCVGGRNPESRAHTYETEAVDYFSLTELPPLSQSRVTRSQIEMLFNHFRNPGLPTEFD